MLIATICLAGSAIGILSALRFCNDRGLQARYRLIALQRAATEIEKAKGQALGSTLTAGTTNQNLSNTGVPGTLTVSRTVTAVGGTPDLYTVQVVSAFNGGAQAVTLTCLVRYGDVN